MLKIIIIIIGYTPNNFITHITILQQMMEKYIIKIVIEDENGDGECASAFA